MSVLRAFLDFPDEAALIGRMVPGYTDLEVDVMNCVKSVRQELEKALQHRAAQVSKFAKLQDEGTAPGLTSARPRPRRNPKRSECWTCLAQALDHHWFDSARPSAGFQGGYRERL